jgi:hypothetical protein
MSVSRSAAAAYIHSRLANLAGEVQQVATDASATGYGPDIDQALRRLGTGESSLASASVADSLSRAYLTLCQYYALDRFAGLLSTKVDFGATAVEGDRDTIFDNIERMLERLAKELKGLGYPVDEAVAWSFGRLGLDFIEPEDT